jgi:hypothetical protein
MLPLQRSAALASRASCLVEPHCSSIACSNCSDSRDSRVASHKTSDPHLSSNPLQHYAIHFARRSVISRGSVRPASARDDATPRAKRFLAHRLLDDGARHDATELRRDGRAAVQNQVRGASLTSTPSTRRLLDGVAVHLAHRLICAQASGLRRSPTTCLRTRPCASSARPSPSR